MVDISIGDVAITEGDAGTATAVFTVARTGGTGAFSVNYATGNGSATAGSDYVATSGTLLFGDNETARTISVTINGDTTVEPNETFVVDLSGAVGATVGDGQGIGIIINDDDTAPAPTVSIGDVAITEGDAGTATAVFTVVRTGGTGAFSVNFATGDGTATAGSDYAATSGTLSFGDNETARTISVTINGDTTVEPNETFVVDLSGAVGATVGDGQGIGTITNDDVAPSVSIGDVAIVEGNAGTRTAVFTVARTGGTGAFSVNYATGNGSATAGSDYVATSGTLLFGDNETARTISVTINGDTTVEPNETFVVDLSGAVGATVGDGQGVGIIINDDDTAPAPTVSIGDVAITEGDAGTATAVFTVVRTGGTGAFSVNFATGDGTATAGSDYAATSGTLSFGDNETARTISVTINGDTTVEPNETFVVDLSGAVGATVGDGQSIGIITNDDVAPSVSIGDVAIVEGNAGTRTAVFTVARTGGTGAFSVNYATGNGSATAGSDYVATSGTLLFGDNETARTISVTINGDTTVEPNQTFVVDLSGAVGATVDDGQGVGIIIDDDTAPTITSDGGGDTATVSVAENTTAVTTVTSDDADGPPPSFSIEGGADAGLFEIDPLSGVLTFVAAPDFEGAGDNIYEVVVRASDGTLFDEQTLMVNVTDVNEVAPAITSDGGGAFAAVAVEEHTTAVTTVTAVDADGPATTFALVGGADQDRFTIDAATGALAFLTGPNFEAPDDADGDNSYEVVVRASDGTLFDEQTLTVEVIDDQVGGADILWQHSLWQHSDGTIVAGGRQLGLAPAGFQIQGIGDFDGDGDSDILWRDDDAGVLTWELENGEFAGEHSQPAAPHTWQVAGTGDFDGDGDDDIVWRHEEGAVTIWEMEDNAYVVNHNQPQAATTWQIAGTRDFDGDGNDDILWRHDEGAVTIWEMQDNGYVVNHNLGVVPTTWQIGGTGDFDSDGDDDVLWHHEEGAVTIWEVEDNAYVVNHNQPDGPTTGEIEGTHDFDSDGDTDILWRLDDGQVITWEMEDLNLVVEQNLGVVSNGWQIRGTGEFDLV